MYLSGAFDKAKVFIEKNDGTLQLFHEINGAKNSWNTISPLIQPDVQSVLIEGCVNDHDREGLLALDFDIQGENFFI